MTVKRETFESKSRRYADALHSIDMLCKDNVVPPTRRLENVTVVVADVLKGWTMTHTTRNGVSGILRTDQRNFDQIPTKGNSMTDKEQYYREALILIAGSFPDNMDRGPASSSTVRRKIANAALAGNRVFFDEGAFKFTEPSRTRVMNVREDCAYDDD